MITYEVYKLIHISAIFTFLMGAAVLLLAQPQGKMWKIVTGLASFGVLLGGMGLMARTTGGFTPWIYAKIVVWLLVTAAGHVIARRCPNHGAAGFVITLALAVAAAYLGINKPTF